MIPALAIVMVFLFLRWLAAAPRDPRAVAVGLALFTVVFLLGMAALAGGRPLL